MGNEIQKVREAVQSQLKQTDELIASNEVIAERISEVNSALSDAAFEVNTTLSSGFTMLGAGLQELCFGVAGGFREVCYKLELQNRTLDAIKEILEKPLDTQGKELRKRAEEAYLNGWIDEAEVDLLEAEKKNYQDFIVYHILGNIYYYHKKSYQKALEYYQKAAKYAAPRSKKYASDALLAAGMVYYKLGNLPDAYESTKKALKSLPSEEEFVITVSDRVLGFLRDNRIHAMKAYREEAGVSLSHAKSIIESIEKRDDYRTAQRSLKTLFAVPIFYHHARYAAKMGRLDEFKDCFKRCISWDPDYLITADRDEMLADVRSEIRQIVKSLREEKNRAIEVWKRDIFSVQKNAENLGISDFQSFIDRDYARYSYLDLLKEAPRVEEACTEMLTKWQEVSSALSVIDKYRFEIPHAIEVARNAGINDVGDLERTLSEINSLHDSKNKRYYAILEMPQKVREIYERSLKKWKSIKSEAIDGLKAKKSNNKNSKFAGLGCLTTILIWILSIMVISVIYDFEPTRKGPAKVLRIADGTKLSGYVFMNGGALEFLSETKSLVCVRIKKERVCYNKKDIFKVAKIDTGYFPDYSNTLSDFEQVFWILVFPIIVWFLSAILIKKANLNSLEEKIQQEASAVEKFEQLYLRRE